MGIHSGGDAKEGYEKDRVREGFATLVQGLFAYPCSHIRDIDSDGRRKTLLGCSRRVATGVR